MGGLVYASREIELVSSLCSPFVATMLGHGQDARGLYLAMEHGIGTVDQSVNVRQRLPDAQCAFYVSSVALALGHLHLRAIAHRDVKTEHILLTESGYVKLTGLGLAKQVPADSKTFTLCGTPEYMAPEVVMEEGHDTAADWWSLGILTYELTVGQTPFVSEGSGTDVLDIYDRICNGPIYFPSTYGKARKSFTKGLLRPNPIWRRDELMVEGAAEDPLMHPWIRDNVDVNGLQLTTQPAPYVPSPRSGKDPEADGPKVRKLDAR